MPATNITSRTLLFLLLGAISGAVFSIIIGVLDSADYLVELWTLWIIEIPFIVLWGIIDREIGWHFSLASFVFATILAVISFGGDTSLAPYVFIKVSLMGIILGENEYISDSFLLRLSSVALPAIMFSFVFGLPFVLNGVAPEIIERFRTEALEMYKTFMEHDQAVNSADNAVMMFEMIFKAGFAVHIISSVVYTWMAFLASSFAFRKLGAEISFLPSFDTYKLPSSFIWLFIVPFGLMLFEYEPVFPLAMNFFVVSCFLYFIQGTAIVIHHMNRMKIGRFPRIAFWFFFFFTFLFSAFILLTIGLADNWFTLRPNRIPTNTHTTDEVD